MKGKLKKTLLISSIALLSVATGVSIGAITYAGYQRAEIIEDPTTSSNLSVSGQGARVSPYYLDIGIWGTIDNSGYSFWALVFKYNSGNTPVTLKYIKGTLNGATYEYAVNTVSYDRIKFFRTNSSNDETLATSTNYQHSYYTTTSPGMATDGTGELEFVSNKSTYQVTGWHGDFIDAVGYWR